MLSEADLTAMVITFKLAGVTTLILLLGTPLDPARKQDIMPYLESLPGKQVYAQAKSVALLS